jgi:hypothetical protein
MADSFFVDPLFIKHGGSHTQDKNQIQNSARSDKELCEILFIKPVTK